MCSTKWLCLIVCVLTVFLAQPVWGQVPVHKWSKGFGDVDYDARNGIVVDGAGNFIITGHFENTVDFGGGPLTSAGGLDVFVAKYDADGNHLWSLRFGNTASDHGRGVAVDSYDNVYVTGRTWGTIDFGGGPVAGYGSSDVFLAKYTSAGAYRWSAIYGTNYAEQVNGIAVDGADNVMIIGEFFGTVDFGGGPLAAAGSGSCPSCERDIFVAKYDGSGAHIWSQRYGDVDLDIGRSIATDAANNVIITGYFEGTVDFGGGTLTSAQDEDIYLAKFNSSGVHLWSQRFGGSGLRNRGAGVASDGAGNVLLTGTFRDTVDFGGGDLMAGREDVFLAKYDGSGTHLWSQSFGGGLPDYGYGIAVDGADNALITGYYSGAVDFGGGPLPSLGPTQIYLAAYNGSGDHLWSKGFGGSGVDMGYAVATHGVGDVYLAGYFEGAVDFGGGTLTSTGANDIFLAKFGLPSAVVVSSIVDVPNDQGRNVRITFPRSGNDHPSASPIVTQYEIYRRIDALPNSLLPVGTASMAERLVAAGEEGMISDSSVLDAGWDFVTMVPAHGVSEYNVIASTLADSTIAQGQHWSVFFVRAATDDQFVFFDSQPDSGYSLDNLQPSAPSAFAVAYNAGSNVLTWGASVDLDFEYFRIDRSDNPNLTITDPPVDYDWSVVHTTAATSWTDQSSQAWRYRYQITAVDHSGNESDPASPGTLTGITERSIPKTVALYQNLPNPFNPTTTIGYDVPYDASPVSLRVYDVTGRLVRVLVDGVTTPGWKSVRWDGKDGNGASVSTGIYFYRLTAGNATLTKKMVFLK